MQIMTSRTKRACVAASAILLLGWGCGSSDEERALVGLVGARCTLNSHCDEHYVCVFEHCHVPCYKDRDCGEGRRCVRVPQTDLEGNEKLRTEATELFVCQLPEQASCANGETCRGEQSCASDLQCRDACESALDCTTLQRCTPRGECASPAWDSFGRDGNLIYVPGGGGAGGAGGVTGMADAGATFVQGGTTVGVTPGAGGDAPELQGGMTAASGGATNVAKGGRSGAGANNAGEASGGDTTGQAGEPSSQSGGNTALGQGGFPSSGGAAQTGGGNGSANGGTGGTLGQVFTYSETADGIEPVANGDRDHTLELLGRARLHLKNADEDWFFITVPDTGRAQIIELTVAQDAKLSASLAAYAKTDNSRLGAETLDMGVSTTFYITVGSGSTTLLQFAGAVGQGFLEFNYRVTDEPDVNEPNNTREQATSIAPNTDVSGHLVIPYSSAISQVMDDWYKVELGVGTASLRLLNNPNIGSIRTSRYTPEFQRVDMIGANFKPGQLGTFTFDVKVPGVYLFQVSMAQIYPFASGAKPANLETPYTFRIEQN